jgi:hypothetical protein
MAARFSGRDPVGLTSAISARGAGRQGGAGTKQRSTLTACRPGNGVAVIRDLAPVRVAVSWAVPTRRVRGPGSGAGTTGGGEPGRNGGAPSPPVVPETAQPLSGTSHLSGWQSVGPCRHAACGVPARGPGRQGEWRLAAPLSPGSRGAGLAESVVPEAGVPVYPHRLSSRKRRSRYPGPRRFPGGSESGPANTPRAGSRLGSLPRT